MRLRPHPALPAAPLVAVAFACGFAAALLRAAEPPATAPGPRLATELGRPSLRAFEPAPATATSQNWAAVEDAAGRVHFANTTGIVTYDGGTWRLTRSERFANVTRAVALGGDGRIYVGSAGNLGWLRPLPDGHHEHVSLLDALPEAARDFQEVFQILAHGDAVYFTTGKHLLIWRSGRFTHIPHAVGRLDAVAGHVYLHSPRSPLERIEGDRLVAVSTDPLFLTDSMRYLGPGPTAGTLLVVSGRNGVHHLDVATGRTVRRPTAIDDQLKTKPVYRALRLDDGSIAIAYVASEGGGLALIGPDGAFLTYLDAAHGLPSSIVYGLAPSRHGGLWLCLDHGTAYLDWPAASTVFQGGNGLERGLTTAILRHDGALYVGNTVGVHRLVPGRAPATPARFERLAAGGTYALVAHGPELLAVSDHKVQRITAAGAEPLVTLPTLAYTMVVSRRDPALRWLGHADGLRAFRVTPAGWRDEGLVPGLGGTVRALVEQPDGTLWAGIDSQGFFRVTPGTANPATGAAVERFTVADPETTRRRRARVGTWRDEVYFLTGNDHRIFRFDAASRAFAPFPGLAALAEGFEINATTQAAQHPGRMWILSLDHDRETPPPPALHQLTADGLRTVPHAVTAPVSVGTVIHEDLAAGVVWMGGSEGLLRIDPARAFAAPPPAPVLVAGSDLPPGTVRPYSANAARFDFVAPASPVGGTRAYRTRLAGFDRDWSPWSAERQRSYTNLAEGTYTFEVEARDPDGLPAPPAKLAFTILPPWWRTWWAYAGGTALFGATLVGFARLRTRALRRRNEQLEKTVAARTEDLRRQNGELARLHQLELDEKITARLAAEKAQLDVLRYQLNPHFLFNSLTSIRSQIPPTQGSARATLDRLADFCRLTLTGRQPDESTTVGEEIAMLRAYLDIEQTRMGELLSVAFDLDPALDAVPLPRLLLLPLVENALKYGQATSVDSLGLKISARRLPGEAAGDPGTGTIVFEIANTGTWVERGSRPGIPSTGIGHDNLRERLRRHYPDAHAFSHAADDGWVVVRLELRRHPAPSVGP
jgi:ligand-binding sensor domain-containing protein